ncbi:hypothetical protein TSUD_323880 [Trifolium subterraneum]|uniref:Reverse transcriptase zinc-binding domain-containing protein n=1 Tax=Trifolium subterraneum TaxID=3900 RepID=A0A2Z6MV73_TRISU|nr:hypothetical protein TSUD_323880 [Trifolium subterraneum]
MVKIRDGVGGIGGGWFRESIVRQVGDGSTAFFWTDPWFGGRPLCERFWCLFDLTGNKSSSNFICVVVAALTSYFTFAGPVLCVWMRRRRKSKRLNIGSSHVALLVPYGRPFGLGLASRRWTLRIHLTTFFGSFTQQVVADRRDFFAAYLACLHLDFVDKKKPSPFQQLRKIIISIVGQG